MLPRIRRRSRSSILGLQRGERKVADAALSSGDGAPLLLHVVDLAWRDRPAGERLLEPVVLGLPLALTHHDGRERGASGRSPGRAHSARRSGPPSEIELTTLRRLYPGAHHAIGVSHSEPIQMTCTLPFHADQMT